jgi:predicted RNA-binding Zn-ribbon protein involved in translation (DUF1610 family)
VEGAFKTKNRLGPKKLGRNNHGADKKMETIKATVKAVISPKDPGARKLMREYDAYKKVLISRIQQTVRPIIKDKSIRVYAQQKWMVDKKLSEYLKNLPFHPMPFHRQSVWIEYSKGFLIHFKTAEGETVCHLHVPEKYYDMVLKACGEDNPILGQVELIEDQKNGWINCHIVLRLPKPEPYEPKGWLGVDTGWNKLATTIACETNPHIRFYNPTFHGKNYKTRIIQLRHLLKEYQRKGRKIKMWENRLQNTIKYAVGVVAKEIVSKAKRLKLGVAMESLTFKPVSKGYLVPRYKLMIAVKTLCEREGVPFKLVPAQYTSQTCPKCGYVNEKNRDEEWFKCLKCGYQTDADLAGAMNIALKAFNGTADEAVNGVGYRPTPKADRGTPRKAGHVASPQASMRDVPIERDATHGIAEKRW